MSHLKDEVLARLVEEEPDEEEMSHLERCEFCRSELEALREQTRALTALPDLEPPEALWRSLEHRLAAEGLIPPGRQAGSVRMRPLLRVAAVLALFLGGGATGFLLRGTSPGEAPAVAGRGDGAETVAEAGERLRRAEAAYIAELARYAELTGADRAADPLSRLAALEGIVLTTRAALEEAPADPVINGYHLTALGQRDAILEQIQRSAASSNTANQEWF